ncbi:MAG: hypothetical protein JKX73_07035, partial [Flavobacteriales bacterium]|nr:hypothetical protein [Flavobacteriales bacterium]
EEYLLNLLFIQKLFLSSFLILNVLSISAQDVTVKLIMPESVIAGEEFVIKVKIGKGNITSFAKLQLAMPEVFDVDSLESDSARFMTSETQAKYIWDRMPIKDTLLVAFKASADPGFSGAKGINGSFSFIVNEEKREVTVSTKAIKVLPLVEASTEPEIAESLEEDDEINRIMAEIEAEPVAEVVKEVVEKVEEKEEILSKEPEPQPVVAEKPVEKPKATSQPVAKEVVSAAKPIIEFRVQILASAVKVDIARLKTKYNLSETIRSEFHNGLWKYTVGTHPTYSDAKSKVPMYVSQKGVEGAFVTAYANGERIGVGEAIKQTK